MVVRAGDATAEKEGMSPLDWTDDGMKRRKEGRRHAFCLQSRAELPSVREYAVSGMFW